MDDSKVHSTPITIKESGWTESAVMDDSEVHSTPISIKKSDDHMMSYLQKQFAKLESHFDIKFNEQNVKLNEVSSDINEVKQQRCV